MNLNFENFRKFSSKDFTMQCPKTDFLRPVIFLETFKRYFNKIDMIPNSEFLPAVIMKPKTFI